MKKRSVLPKRGVLPRKGRGAPKRRAWELGLSVARSFTALERSRTGLRPDGRVFELRLDVTQLKTRVRFLLEILSEQEWDLGLRFADIAESQELNQSYRAKAYPTDVLSFSAYDENRSLLSQGLPDSETRRLGDLCLCVPVCLLQARERHVSLSSELERMLVHGLCHLKGFDHERSDVSEKVMSTLESVLRRELVKEFGQPRWATNMEWI